VSAGRVRLIPLGILIVLCSNVASCVEEQSPRVEEQPPPAATGLVLLPVRSDPTIAFSLWFKVGSQNDPPGKEGLAYLTGRMIADASTENNPYEDVLEKLYPIASSYRVRVDREMTTLTGRTHRDNLAVFFGLFEDAYLRPAFDADDFERVKRDAINYLENTLRYASDEELGKGTLLDSIFAGTAYAHPSQGTVDGLNEITLEDVRSFYRRYYTADNVTPGLAGGFDAALEDTLQSSLSRLPETGERIAVAIQPEEIEGRHLVLVSKPGADASISFGIPIDVRRGERDFYALWIANSWLGEHRNRASHLFGVIREARGLNYGDYSYIEAFPGGGQRSMPPVNVGRNQQIFEVWIRTLPNHQAHFALRAAVRELTRLVDDGLSQEQFELTRTFLKKYSLHFSETTAERLGYAMDDEFYAIGGEGHLARFRRMMDELTLEEVNAVLRRQLRPDRLKIAIVTGEAERLLSAIASEEPSPLEYESPKPQAILDEDQIISAFPLATPREHIQVISVDAMFQTGRGQ